MKLMTRKTKTMTRYYFALTDDFGVLCVDQMDENEEWTPETVALLANHYPNAVYFEVTK